ncbi:hypothetical protein F8388_012686 [Cannabis sativa]|uniref:GOLD domain-containing protein n=1 Tax=Cannabis sativa TaxID=3483 RepID=A0A7J6HCW7_CANSA|nr:hypothetical protein F8388_012686 [Cannabis sativa]
MQHSTPIPTLLPISFSSPFEPSLAPNIVVTSQYGNSYHHAEHITLGQFAFVAAEAGDYMAFFFAPDHNPQITFSVDFDWKTSVVAKDWFNVAMKGSVDVRCCVKKLRTTFGSCKETVKHYRKRPRKELNRGQS